jgi:hypothetical protein
MIGRAQNDLHAENLGLGAKDVRVTAVAFVAESINAFGSEQ